MQLSPPQIDSMIAPMDATDLPKCFFKKWPGTNNIWFKGSRPCRRPRKKNTRMRLSSEMQRGPTRRRKAPENRTSPRQMAKVVQKAAKTAGKGAAERLKAGSSLTSLSEATRKLDGQSRPESCQKRRQGRCGAFEGRLLPNVAFWSHQKNTGQVSDRWPKSSGKLPKAPARALRRVSRQATAERRFLKPLEN